MTRFFRAVCIAFTSHFVIGFLVVVSARAAIAQDDPTTGANNFPQFRNLSGLAGGGYGVDMRGYSSLTGPVALSTPVAYVLGRSHFRIGGARASFSGDPHFFRKANGTSVLTYGHTLGRFNIAVTDMALSEQWDQSFHLQIQYISSPGSLWVGSIGVQDWGGGGGSSGDGFPQDVRSSRSVFGVVTYRWDMPHSPVFISAGGGTRRFRQGFVNASTQVVKPVRAWVEHDGYGVNAGGLLTLHSGRGRSSVEYNLLYGMIKLRYAVAALVVGF